MLAEKQIEKMLLKLQRFERTLEPLLFEKVGNIEVLRYETMERLTSPPGLVVPNPNTEIWNCSPMQPENTPFVPCSEGDKWGSENGFCWFTGSFTVPYELDGKTLFLYPRVGRNEALLWVNGRPFGIFSNSLTGDPPADHYCNMISKCAKSGDILNIALECYAGHYVKGCMPFDNSPYPDYTYQFKSFDVCIMNPDVSDFLFDLKTLNQMAASLDKNSYRRADIIRGLQKVHETVYYSYDNIDRDAFFKALADASAYLKERLSRKNSDTAPYAGFIGHSHMDTAWLWTIDDTIKKCARTYSNQMNLMSRYDEYTFVQSSAYHSEMMRLHYPMLFEEMREMTANGRYEPNGGVWIECDCNIPSGEYIVRQFLWGQRYTREHFNYTSDCFWLPDTFGYSASLPQIMKKCGINYFLTTKMAWNDTVKFPYDSFYWRGIDGTSVLTHLNKTHIWPDPSNMIEYVVDGANTDDTVKEKIASDMRLLSYGFGDGGGGPQFEMIEMSRRVRDLEGLPRSEHTTVSRFMKRLEDSIHDPSEYNGELYLQLHRGTLTNQHTIKRNNRLAEIALHDLEYVTVANAIRESITADGQEIRPLMNTLLVNQFHDILPGTCIPAAHEQSIKETTGLIEKAKSMTMEALAPRTADDTRDAVVSVLNTLSFQRDDVIYVEARPGLIVKGCCEQQSFTDIAGRSLIAIKHAGIPAFSSVRFELEEGIINSPSSFEWDGHRLVTPYAIAEFDESGFIASFVDKHNNRELRGGGYPLNTFLMAEDVPLLWDNWDIDADYALKLKPCASLLSREVVADGSVEFRIRSRYAISSRSSLTQDMIFYSDSPVVRFETVMDWNDDHRLLKTSFDTNIHVSYARHEIQFGFICRPTTRNTDEEKARFEVSNHKYTDISESRYGAAILNDCKYGISVNNGELALTLHKGGCRPDYNGDKGLHECTYAFYPHNEGFSVENVVRQSYQLNYKPVIIGEGYESPSLLSVDTGNIIIETVKPCEDAEKAFIVRLYDAEGTYTRARIRPGFDVVKVEETDMLEEPLRTIPCTDGFDIELKAFEIKTIKIYYQ